MENVVWRRSVMAWKELMYTEEEYKYIYIYIEKERPNHLLCSPIYPLSSNVPTDCRPSMQIRLVSTIIINLFVQVSLGPPVVKG